MSYAEVARRSSVASSSAVVPENWMAPFSSTYAGPRSPATAPRSAPPAGSAAPACRRDEAEQLLDQQRREPERGLVQDQQARLAHQAAADGEHLLLAAGERAGELPVRSFRRGKSANTRSRLAARAARAPGDSAELQVLAHRQVGEHAPALGHLDQAQARPRRPCARVMSAPSKRICPSAPARARHSVWLKRGLAGAVASEHRDDLARGHVAGRRRAAPPPRRSRRASRAPRAEPSCGSALAGAAAARCRGPGRPRSPRRRASPPPACRGRSAGPAPAPTPCLRGSSPPASRARSSAR